jgi:AbrB family looped-hinge helix DNA binding protein
MRCTLDRAGRIVAPEVIRRRAGLLGGAEVEVRYRDGRVEIEPVARRVKRVRRGPLQVAVPTRPGGPLSAAVVRAARDRLRARRG